MSDYTLKDSSHPLRLFNSAAWQVNANTLPKMLAMVYLHGYNICLTLLGLCLMGYSGFLINKHNSGWAKLLMCVASYCIATGCVGWLLPNFLSSRLVCAPLFWILNSLLFCFTLACAVMSFFPRVFVGEVAKLDIHALNRKNGGVWLMNHRLDMNVFTILGSCLILTAIGCLAYLYSKHDQVVVKAQPMNIHNNAVDRRRPNNNLNSNQNDIQLGRSY